MFENYFNIAIIAPTDQRTYNSKEGLKVVNMKINKIFGNLINKLEDESISIWYYVATFLAIVFLRDFLEFFLYHFASIDFSIVFHFSLYYIFIALFMILLLNFMTKEKVLRVTRVVLPMFVVLLIPILIDSIARSFGNPSIAPAYIYTNGFLDIIFRFFTFFGSTVDGMGITIGMKVEIAISLILLFLYLRHKSCATAKSVYGLFLFYTGLFLSFITPSIISGIEIFFQAWIHFLFGIKTVAASGYNEFVFVDFFLIIIFFLVAYLFRVIDLRLFEKIYTEFKFRLTRILHFSLMVILGIAFATINPSSWQNSSISLVDYIFTLVCLVLSISCFFIFSCMVNNVVDLKADLINKSDRPIIYEEKDRKNYFLVMWIIFLFGAMFAISVNFKALLFMLCFAGAYFLYSAPPFRLKSIGFPSKLIIGFNSLLMVMLGYMLVPDKTVLDLHTFNSISAILPLRYVIFILLFSFPINYIDLKDAEGDKSEGIQTLPVLLGIKKAKILVGLFFVALYLGSYFIIQNSTFMLLLLAASIIQYYVINFRKYSDKLVSYVYLTALVVFIIFVFGSKS